MPSATVTLGSLVLRAAEVDVGPLPREYGVQTNALAAAPVQTTDYISGYQQVTVQVLLQGIDTISETAAEHLRRLRSNLKAEVGRTSNTLSIDYGDGLAPDEFSVYLNDDFTYVLAPHQSQSHLAACTIILNCLPA